MDWEELKENARAPLGWGMGFCGVLCIVAACLFVGTVVNPDLITRRPVNGQVYHPGYYRKHFPLSEPVRLALAVPLLLGGIALSASGHRLSSGPPSGW
jgi:hypothetical protein